MAFPKQNVHGQVLKGNVNEEGGPVTPPCFGRGGGKHQQTAGGLTCAGGLPMAKPFRKTQFCPSVAERPTTSKLLHGDCREEVAHQSVSIAIAPCAPR